jgi:hypothetical protein
MLPVLPIEGRVVDAKIRLDLTVPWAVLSPDVIGSRLGGEVSTGVPRGGVWGFPTPRTSSEVLTKPSRIPSSVENTS